MTDTRTHASTEFVLCPACRNQASLVAGGICPACGARHNPDIHAPSGHRWRDLHEKVNEQLLGLEIAVDAVLSGKPVSVDTRARMERVEHTRALKLLDGAVRRNVSAAPEVGDQLNVLDAKMAKLCDQIAEINDGIRRLEAGYDRPDRRGLPTTRITAARAMTLRNAATKGSWQVRPGVGQSESLSIVGGERARNLVCFGVCGPADAAFIAAGPAIVDALAATEAERDAEREESRRLAAERDVLLTQLRRRTSS